MDCDETCDGWGLPMMVIKEVMVLLWAMDWRVRRLIMAIVFTGSSVIIVMRT